MKMDTNSVACFPPCVAVMSYFGAINSKPKCRGDLGAFRHQETSTIVRDVQYRTVDCFRTAGDMQLPGFQREFPPVLTSFQHCMFPLGF